MLCTHKTHEDDDVLFRILDDTDGSTVFATPELVDTALGPGVDEAGLCGSGPNGQSVSEHERKRNRKRNRKHSKHWHVQH